MKTIYTLFPDVLNLNGDAANSLVLQKNFQWMGEQAQVLPVSNEVELEELIRLVKTAQQGIFVTIGHGSVAGMKSLAAFDEQVRTLIDLMVEAKTPGIVVGSSLVWAGMDVMTKQERRSEFVLAEVADRGWPSQGLGYLNSDLTLDPIVIKGNVILTLLHGPFLAKNPKWVSSVLLAMGGQVNASESRSLAEGYVDEIWRLETNH
jgi:CobQ-like glutamine amidotransferase family enzyme